MSNRQIYTLAIWKVKPGHESEFIDAWQAFASWTSDSLPGAGAGTLLQDAQDPQRFVSFGPWEGGEAVAQWRAHARFKEFVAEAEQLCEAFEPHNMIRVGRSQTA